MNPIKFFHLLAGPFLVICFFGWISFAALANLNAPLAVNLIDAVATFGAGK